MGATLARAIFGPLGGIVEIGAVAATGTWSVADASVGDLVRTRQDEVGQLMAAIREIGGFSERPMSIADELGYLREHEVTANSRRRYDACAGWGRISNCRSS